MIEQLRELVDEVESLPAGIAHGDACNRNLMISASRPELVMIDFGFVRHAPLGFDLGQLILGEVQTGERPADDLESDWSASLSAYVEGMRAEGNETELAGVGRASAICMAIFNGLTAIPFENLEQPPEARLDTLCKNRAEIADSHWRDGRDAQLGGSLSHGSYGVQRRHSFTGADLLVLGHLLAHDVQYCRQWQVEGSTDGRQQLTRGFLLASLNFRQIAEAHLRRFGDFTQRPSLCHALLTKRFADQLTDQHRLDRTLGSHTQTVPTPGDNLGDARSGRGR